MQHRTSVRSGDVVYFGVERAGVFTATGIRYAVRVDRDTVRDLRPNDDVQQPPAAFPQRPGALDGLLGPALQELVQHEDAFQLTVQAPADATGLPVVVFLPGGGFISGSGHARWYADAQFVSAAEVVLVTVNYRLGALGYGFAGDDATNTPLDDLVRALRWVRENIETFGGNPAHLTLAGDSAGAWWAYALCRLEETRGWIQRALLVSLPRIAPLTVHEASVFNDEFFDEFGGHEEARSVSLSQLLDVQGEIAARHRSAGFVWRPTVSSRTPEHFSDFYRSAAELHVPEVFMMRAAEESAGFLRNLPAEAFTAETLNDYIECTFAEPAHVYRYLAAFEHHEDSYLDRVRAQTLADFVLPTIEIAAGAPDAISVTHARIDLQSGLDRACSPHCLALPLIFGNPQHWHDAPMFQNINRHDAEVVCKDVQQVVGAFARGAKTVISPGHTLTFGPRGMEELRESGLELSLRAH